MRKKDFWLSIAAGVITAVFLLFTFRNISVLLFLEHYKTALVLAVPIVFLAGFWIGHLLMRVKGLSFMGQFSKFAIVGFVNTSIDFGVLNFLITVSGITQGAFLALFNTISFSAAVTNSFFWNRLWTFEDHRDPGNVYEFFQFVVVTVLAVLINTSILYILTTLVGPHFGLDPKTWANVSKAAATGISLFWNFTGYKLIVFKKAPTS